MCVLFVARCGTVRAWLILLPPDCPPHVRRPAEQLSERQDAKPVRNLLRTSKDAQIHRSPRACRRSTRFAVLGMSLSALLDISPAHDFLRGLLSLVQEFDAMPEERFGGRGVSPAPLTAAQPAFRPQSGWLTRSTRSATAEESLQGWLEVAERRRDARRRRRRRSGLLDGSAAGGWRSELPLHAEHCAS